ncbi:MAG: DNA methylase, partial [Clostridia bacterium]|nr:DNA methylase [Clostridia bacterium]
ATHYLAPAGMDAREFAMTMIREVLRETGITATAGIGTNLYLAKVAMDIVAKHIPADENGVRIAELDEISYREKLWDHRPLTDFWRVGPGIARKLESHGIFTMGDVARVSLGPENSLRNEELLFRLFGVNAELLIDHAWGYEPAEIAECKAFRPESKSLGQGQVLTRPYAFKEGRIVAREMAEALSYALMEKGYYTDQIVLDVGYDVENLQDPGRAARFRGESETDRYGRKVPKGVHGSENLGRYTASARMLENAVGAVFDRIVDKELLIRRLNVAAVRLLTEEEKKEADASPVQLTLTGDPAPDGNEEASLSRERKKQETILGLREKYGKNAVIRGLNMQEGATAVERNRQIGGHRA